MATYLMLGRYSLDALDAISAKRTDKASAVIRENGGELVAAYALLGEADLAVIIDLPDNEHAMKTGVALSTLLGVTFCTMPAVPIEEFDRLMR